MIEYAIVGIKKLVVTWIFNPCYSYKITTSNKSVQNNVNEMLIVNTNSCMRFFETLFAYLSSETKKERIW